MPTTITNRFHNTEITIRANSGDAVSLATLRKVQKALCGIRECVCGDLAGSRDSEYTLRYADGRGTIRVERTRETETSPELIGGTNS